MVPFVLSWLAYSANCAVCTLVVPSSMPFLKVSSSSSIICLLYLIIGKLNLEIPNFSVSLVIVVLVNYVFVRLDILSGVVGCFSYLFLNMYEPTPSFKTYSKCFSRCSYGQKYWNWRSKSNVGQI